jgi:rod shape-determining protein MreD
MDTINRYGAPVTLAKFALIVIAIVVAQGILSIKLQAFTFFDLPLIYSIYYGFVLASPIGSIAIGSSLGLMQDSLSGAVLGTNGFTKTLIGFLAATAGSKFDVEQPITRALALVLFTCLDLVLKVVLGGITGPDLSEATGPSAGTWVLSAVFNLLLGMILFGYRSRFGNATA